MEVEQSTHGDRSNDWRRLWCQALQMDQKGLAPHPMWLIFVFLDLMLCTLCVQTCWSSKTPLSNCSYKDGRMKLSKMFRNASTTALPQSNSCFQATIVLATGKPKLLYWSDQKERQYWLFQRTCLYWPRVQWQWTVQHCRRRVAWHLMTQDMEAVAWQWKPFHGVLHELFLS